MNQEFQEKRKIIITVLAGLLMGTLLLIFGLSVQGNILPTLLNYLIAVFLYLITFLVIYKQNQKAHQHLYVYLMILSILMFIIATISIISRFLS